MKSPAKRKRLAELPPLLPLNRFGQATPCKLCGHVCPPFDVVDFNKFCSSTNAYAFGLSGITVTYYRCPWCRLLFTRFFDDWSHSDFQRFIYNEDYIRVDGAYATDRPAKDSAAVAALLDGLAKDMRILDYGSGNGTFARGLQARGYTDVTSYDPFSQPEPPDGQFDLITLFEVIEHVPDSEAVLRAVGKLLRPGAAILFSSGFQPKDIATIRCNWWYVGPRNGHCSIFATETMAMLAESLGLALRGETGLCALQSWPPSEITSHVTRQMPAPLFVRHLTPPGPETGDGSAVKPRAWYRVEETPAGAFRWTASPEMAWTLPPPPQAPARLRLLLPTLNECRPGYARACTLHVAGRSFDTTLVDGALQADVQAGYAPQTVTLRGPAFPEPPAGEKRRTIGLAVLMP